VQTPIQAHQLVKGLANTFDWIHKWARILLSLIYCSWDIYRDPFQKRIFKYHSWYLTHFCWLEVQKPTQKLQSVKGSDNTFGWQPKWARTLPSLIYCSYDIYRDHLKKKIKYQSWYMTPCFRLEVQKPIQALQSVKGPATTFDQNPKWVRTLPSLIYFSWDIYRDPLHKQNFKYQSWYLTPYYGLEEEIPTQALQLGKGPENIFDWSPKWTRNLLSFDICSWVIYRLPSKSKYQSSISGQLKAYFGVAKGSRPLRMG
jgi:hypothetical protein